MSDNGSCCSGGCDCGCSAQKQETKKINVDFLYLDLSICERCQGTENSLHEAIRDVSTVLNAAGYDISLNEVNMTTKELAVEYEFVSSPTIRINGRDIALEVKESCCEDCGDLCGDSVDCRVWEYDGQEYTVPPKALIVDAILKEVYAPHLAGVKKEAYQLPENLKRFYEAQEKK